MIDPKNYPMNYPTNLSMDYPINGPTNDPMNFPINEPFFMELQQILMGDKISSSPYVLEMDRNVTCSVLCQRNMDKVGDTITVVVYANATWYYLQCYIFYAINTLLVCY